MRKLEAKSEIPLISGNSPSIGIMGRMATNLRTELLEDRELNIDFITRHDLYKHLPKLIEECYAIDVGTEHCSVPTKKPYDVTLSKFEIFL
jgi:hypothetical protein